VAADGQLGPVSRFIRERLGDLLNTRRVVVWYDAAGAFRALAANLNLPGCVVVSAADSALRARREAEAVYQRLDEPDGSAEARRNLLVYVPAPRGATPEDQQQDPFEGLARCGVAFGAQEAETLQSLALRALPDHAAEINRLFRDGQPTLDLLDTLPSRARFPLVRQALGTESAAEALAAALTRSDIEEALQRVPGALAELERLAHDACGLPTVSASTWPALRERLASYLLVGELAADLPDGLPPALATVPHADAAHRDTVLAVCERLRETEAGREVYLRLATEIEATLRLPSVLGTDTKLGSRDTFPCQERLRLRALVDAARSGNLVQARSLVGGARSSAWRQEPERAVLWRTAQRCLDFLELARAASSQVLSAQTSALIDAYVANDGLWRLDRAQRLYENAAAECAQSDDVDPLVQLCRARYREVTSPAQIAFQNAVQNEGWPPENPRRQTQVFDSLVWPELEERRKVAYVLVDSLRYEMGRDLAEALDDLGSVTVLPITAVLPSTTIYGMAALLPGADGALTLVEHRGDLIPSLGSTPLPGLAARRALLTERFGDRFVDLDLDEILSTASKRLASRLGNADLAVVRTQDIDALGEGPSLFLARKFMSTVISDLRAAAARLAGLGYTTLVFVADHGHVLVPEILAGDVVNPPPGEWMVRKRRVLLGKAHAAATAGSIVLRARDVGIDGAAEELVTPIGFKTFENGAGYFHGGLSLQECVVPAIVVHARKPATATGVERVAISYKSDRFTSRIVGLKLSLISMFTPSLAVRLEAFDGTGARARRVGVAGDCDARDPVTCEILLRAGVDTPVPLVIDPDFSGPSVDVRAIDPRTGAILAHLELKNAGLD
jgi:hypothetical protein